MDGLNLQQLLSQLADRFLGPPVPYQYTTVGILWISSLILAASVLIKFFTYKIHHVDRKDIKRHPVETFSMTAVIIVIFNILQYGHGTLPGTAKFRLLALIFGTSWVFLGVGLHIWSKIAIGHYWSNQIEQTSDHALVTSGPYTIVRHPMYSSLVLWLFGLSVTFLNYLSLVVTVCVFLPMLIVRSRAEDRFLANLAPTEFALFSRRIRQLRPAFDGKVALILRLLLIGTFAGLTWIDPLNIQHVILMAVIHFATGLVVSPPKVSFSYINKSLFIILIFLGALHFPVFRYLYWVVLAFNIWGLFGNCPCMIVYERFNGCPCWRWLRRQGQ